MAAFIKSELPQRYPGLKIKYVRGADPILKLLDEDDDVVEVSGLSQSFFQSKMLLSTYYLPLFSDSCYRQVEH